MLMNVSTELVMTLVPDPRGRLRIDFEMLPVRWWTLEGVEGVEAKHGLGGDGSYFPT